MRKDAPLPSDKVVPVILPDYPPDYVLALVDLLWMATGCPADIPS